MSVIIFLLVLFVLVLVHEWGHFIVAKKTGMRVDEFGIGFPPKLFSIKRGETEYTFNLLPIGGFVKIFGENKEEGADTSDNERAFSSRPKWAQALVLIAGVTMNILFAWLLFTIAFMIGVPTAVDESTASSEAQLMVVGTLAGGPAEDLIPAGSTITSVSSADEVLNNPMPSSFSDFIVNHAPEQVMVTYQFDGAEQEVSIIPKTGLLETDPDKYVIGTSLTLVELQKKPIHLAVIDGFKSSVNGLVAITVGLGALIGQSITGTADFSTIAGPVGIVGMVGDAAAFGVVALLTFTAIISLNLAVINLLPFPALDGGRLVFVAIEAITGKEIPPIWTGWVNTAGFMLLILLMVAVTYNDILRLL